MGVSKLQKSGSAKAGEMGVGEPGSPTYRRSLQILLQMDQLCTTLRVGSPVVVGGKKDLPQSGFSTNIAGGLVGPPYLRILLQQLHLVLQICQGSTIFGGAE